jgi:chorismate-pyruvate lyase
VPDPFAWKTLDRDSEKFLDGLIDQFYRDSTQLGRFSLVELTDAPQPYAMLLAHNRHMTVTVEAFHRDAVDVKVLRSQTHGDSYSREILLQAQQSGQVVQYGIVRIHLHRIAEEPKREILEEKKPLGRVLIEHQVLREVELFKLWQIHCGPVLARLFSVASDTVTFGRTAIIHCDGEPAIELLEIVRPVGIPGYP